MADEQQAQPTYAFGECFILGVPNGRVANAVIQVDGTGQMVDMQPLAVPDQDVSSDTPDIPDTSAQEEEPTLGVNPVQSVQPNTGG